MFSKLDADGVLYTVMCREDGTVVDDLLVSQVAEDRAFVVVNASNIDKDFAHMKSLLRGRRDAGKHERRMGAARRAGAKAHETVRATPMLAAICPEVDSIPSLSLALARRGR